MVHGDRLVRNRSSAVDAALGPCVHDSEWVDERRDEHVGESLMLFLGGRSAEVRGASKTWS